MASPQVSVIIPTCNRQRSLAKAIRSVLCQTYGDFELFVVDDASDESIDGILSSFQDSRLRSVRHPFRRGAAAARNTGIRNTSGELVAFLDDDDVWYADKLGRQVPVLLNGASCVGAVYTGYEVVDRDTRKVVSRMTPEHRGNLSSVLLNGNCVGPTSTILLKRKCFETAGIFDENLPSFQEYDLWLRISKAYEFDYISESLFSYHVHSDRIWTNPKAIQAGLDMLVNKYGASTTFKKTCGLRYLWVAAQFCEAGNGREARETLWRAIPLQPFNFRYYIYLLLSLLSKRTYRSFQRSKARLFAGLSTSRHANI